MKLIVVDVIEESSDLQATCDWIRSLGLDPVKVRPWAAIIDSGDGWKLHMLQFRTGPDGNKHTISHGDVDDVASDPIVADASDTTHWPAWFSGLGPIEVPDAPGETIVRALWLASNARTASSARRHQAEREETSPTC